MAEQNLPLSEEVVRNILKEYNYTLPVLVDQSASFSKAWHAYVSPTVSLVSKDGRVTNFEGGNLDPALLEKSIQKALKDIPAVALPPKEYTSESEAKPCGHNHTIFVGNRFGKAWSPEVFTANGPWISHPLWLESGGKEKVQLDLMTSKNKIGILAESKPGRSSRINLFLDGQKVPLNLRGRDVQEDKGNTFVSVQGLKMYEAISHSMNLKEAGQKLTLTTDSGGLKLRALETLPNCLESD